MCKYLATKPYPKSNYKKLHCNPVTTQFCLNLENTVTERLQSLKLTTNEFSSDAQTLMQKHKKYEKNKAIS
jgi:hypothetical protein